MPPSTPYSFELVSFLNPLHGREARYPKFRTFNDDLHLNHVVDGYAVLVIHGRRIKVTPGEVFFIPPFTEHCVIKIEGVPLEMLNFHFHLRGGQGRTILDEFELPTTFTPRGLAKIQRDLKRWYEIWVTGKVADSQLVAAELHRVAAGYFLQNSKQVRVIQTRDGQMIALRNRIAHAAVKTYDAETFAHSVHLGVSQMNRRFRQSWGLSPKSYWQKIRLTQVRNALRYSDASLNAIAEQFEFSDVYYFSRWFKKMEGVAPGAFRRVKTWAM